MGIEYNTISMTQHCELNFYWVRGENHRLYCRQNRVGKSPRCVGCHVTLFLQPRLTDVEYSNEECISTSEEGGPNQGVGRIWARYVTNKRKLQTAERFRQYTNCWPWEIIEERYNPSL